jgi:hypothetical protein
MSSGSNGQPELDQFGCYWRRSGDPGYEYVCSETSEIIGCVREAGDGTVTATAYSISGWFVNETAAKNWITAEYADSVKAGEMVAAAGLKTPSSLDKNGCAWLMVVPEGLYYVCGESDEVYGHVIKPNGRVIVHAYVTKSGNCWYKKFIKEDSARKWVEQSIGTINRADGGSPTEQDLIIIKQHRVLADD